MSQVVLLELRVSDDLVESTVLVGAGADLFGHLVGHCAPVPGANFSCAWLLFLVELVHRHVGIDAEALLEQCQLHCRGDLETFDRVFGAEWVQTNHFAAELTIELYVDAPYAAFGPRSLAPLGDDVVLFSLLRLLVGDPPCEFLLGNLRILCL